MTNNIQNDEKINQALNDTERKLISIEIQADESRVLIQSMECTNVGDVELEETSNLDFGVKNAYSFDYDGSKDKTDIILLVIDKLADKGAEFYDIADTTEYNDNFKRNDLLEENNNIITSHARSYA